MKKVISLLVIIPFIGMAYTSNDLSNAELLAQKNIITLQQSEAGYRLDDNITRAEVIGIALKIKGIYLPEDYKCKKYFSDTIKQDWVCRAIEIARDAELISQNNKTARPQDPITRAEAFAILYKVSWLSPIQDYTVFTPTDKDITQWQKDLFVQVRNSDIEIPGVQYVSENHYKFSPNRFATRAEVLAFSIQSVITNGGDTSSSTTISVVDGDTIRYGSLTIRMIGIDAPESNTARYGYSECYGSEASKYLTATLKNVKEVTIVKDSSQGETDKYWRTLAYVFLWDTNINERMIADGYAFEYTYDKAYQYQLNFKEAEKKAKDGGLGMWSTSTCFGDRKKGTVAEGIGSGDIPTVTINRTYYLGPKGGCYYINDIGNKMYVERNLCN